MCRKEKNYKLSIVTESKFSLQLVFEYLIGELGFSQLVATAFEYTAIKSTLLVRPSFLARILSWTRPAIAVKVSSLEPDGEGEITITITFVAVPMMQIREFRGYSMVHFQEVSEITEAK